MFHLVRHRENRTLMTKINELISKKMEKSYMNSENNNQAEIIQLRRNLANARANREIVRNILQGLITGRVNLMIFIRLIMRLRGLLNSFTTILKSLLKWMEWI